MCHGGSTGVASGSVSLTCSSSESVDGGSLIKYCLPRHTGVTPAPCPSVSAGAIDIAS